MTASVRTTAPSGKAPSTSGRNPAVSGRNPAVRGASASGRNPAVSGRNAAVSGRTYVNKDQAPEAGMPAEIPVAGFFRVRLITPQETVFDGEVVRLSLSTEVGLMELLPRHEAVMAPLAMAPMELTPVDGEPRMFSLLGGFLDHNSHETVLLADAAEPAEDIDVGRAQQAMQRARERLEEVTHVGEAQEARIDIDRAQLALMRSLVRLQASGHPYKG